MKTFRILALLLSAALALACNGKEDPENGRKTDKDSFWTHTAPLVSKVEVSSDGTLLETYEYTYDATGRMLTLVKTDRLSGEVLLNLQYTYPSEYRMRSTGKISPLTSNRFITADYDPDAKTLVYSGSWSGAWKYSTTLDGNGLAAGTACLEDFAAKAGRYSSGMDYSESYAASDGTITSITIGTEIKARSSRATHTVGSAALTREYTCSSREDRQNFAAYLIPCEFPVWIAAGLPGNKRLITGISGKTGSIPAPETTVIDYSFTSEGDIDTAIRTDYNAGTAYLVRTYKFSYQ